MRLRALAEVAFAFGVMHVAFRAIQRFTYWGHWESVTGMNFTPGVCMLAVSLLMIGLRTRRLGALAEHGLTPRPYATGLGAGLTTTLVLTIFGAVLIATGVRVGAARSDFSVALVTALASLLATWAVLKLLAGRGDSGAEEGLSGKLVAPNTLLLLGVLLAPILFAAWQGRVFNKELLTVAWIVIGSAIGEEVLFRGYVQSRLNGVFGKPWKLVGVEFGPGLLLATLLFGFVHLLNPFDYFGGEQSLAWPHFIATASTLYYGFLRERTGSVLAPAIVHALTNIGGRLPELFGVPSAG